MDAHTCPHVYKHTYQRVVWQQIMLCEVERLLKTHKISKQALEKTKILHVLITSKNNEPII